MAEFIRRYQDIYGTKIQGVSPEVATAFKSHDWPGNVRELEHTIEGSMLLVTEYETELQLSHLPAKILGSDDLIKRTKTPKKIDLTATVAEFEANLISKSLAENGGNISATANCLHIHRNVLYRKMEKFNIKK